MNRRHFLNTLSIALGSAVLDPERLLWVPGKMVSMSGPRFEEWMWYHFAPHDGYDGYIGPVAMWNRPLTQKEMEFLGVWLA